MKFNKKFFQKFIYILFLFFISAILGGMMETIYVFLLFQKFDIGGFMYGPWRPIYGFGCLLLYFITRKVKGGNLAIFFQCFFICSIFEYLSSYFLELIFNRTWWNYSHLFLNLNGRICLSGLLCFGIGCCAAIYYIGPYLNHYFQKINIKILLVVCVLLMSLFIFDNIYTNCYPRIGKGITTSIKKD